MKKLLLICNAILSIAIAQPSNPSFEQVDSLGETAFWKLSQGKSLRYSVLQFGALPFTAADGNYFISLESDTTAATIAALLSQSFAITDTLRKIGFEYLYLPETSIQRAGFTAIATRWNTNQRDTIYAIKDSIAPVVDSNRVLLQWNNFEVTLPLATTADTIHIQLTNDVNLAPGKSVRLLVDHIQIGEFPVGLPSFPFNPVFDIYPNPATTQVNISSRNAFTKIEWYSIQGNMLLQSIGSWNHLSVNTESLTSGIYLVKITWPNGKTRFKKCVIQ